MVELRNFSAIIMKPITSNIKQNNFAGQNMKSQQATHVRPSQVFLGASNLSYMERNCHIISGFDPMLQCLIKHFVLQITVTEDGTLGVHGWLPYDKSISNYFTFEKDPTSSNPR